jgi:Tol biopolymer transport system component
MKKRLFAMLSVVVVLCASCASAPFTAISGFAAPHVLAARLSSGRLLYVRNGSIEELTTNGSQKLLAANPGNWTYMDPAFSPDGQQIAFVKREKNFSDIGVMNADGSNQILLTHDQSNVIPDNLWAVSPTWSADGNHIAFASDRGKDEATGSIDLRIWLLNLGTRGLVRLTTPFFQAGGDANPQFRPGHPHQLVYAKWRYAPDGATTYAVLMLLDLRTGVEYALTPLDGANFEPAWSPDGKVLAFVHRGTSTDDIVAATVPDSVTQNVVLKWSTLVSGGMNAEPCFSPNGRHLAYVGETSNNFALYQVGITLGPTITVQGSPEQLVGTPVDAASRLSWAR